MLRSFVISILAVAVVTTLSHAQSPVSPEPVFLRAQEMVSDGNAAAGRAIVDSIVNATTLTSPRYPEALFWRASLAANASDAERDYRHIVVDFPLAPRAEEALLRLAQLQLSRGDRDGALAHLRRIGSDYPGGRAQARAGYWTARVLFEKNDIAAACVANAGALALASPAEIELRNQIQYLSQRCPTQTATTQPAAPPTLRPPPTASDSKPTVLPAPSVPSASAGKTDPIVPPPVMVEKPVAKVEKPVTPRIPAERPAASSSGGWSVQVAAYNTRAEGEKFAATLEAKGYDARVDGTVKPFRVKIGRYSTAAEANAALAKIKAKRMDGFVTRAQ